MIAGDLSIFKSDIPLVLLLPKTIPSKYIFFATSDNIFVR